MGRLAEQGMTVGWGVVSGYMAVLGGLLLYARLEDLQGWRTRASVAGIFVVASAGVFSKENAAVLLGLMVLWDLCRATPPGLPSGRRAAAQ